MPRFAQLLLFATLISISNLAGAIPADTYGARDVIIHDAGETGFGGEHVGLAEYRRATSPPDPQQEGASVDSAEAALDSVNEDFKLSLPKLGSPKKVATAVPPPAKTTAIKVTTAKETPTLAQITSTTSKSTAAESITTQNTITRASSTAALTTSTTAAADSSVTSTSTTTEGASCPLPTTGGSKSSTSTTSSSSSIISKIKSIFIRDAPEFVGFHGTNSDTASLWTTTGFLIKPTKPSGFFDFLGLATSSSTGTSGADEELGPGVYVTDDLEIAVAFANNNAKVNPGKTAQICALFARSSSNWRTVIKKAFIPENLVGDSSTASIRAAKETSRILHIKSVIPGVSATSVVKFSLLNRSSKTGQLVIPASITNQFSAQCFDTTAAPPSGTSAFPAFSYNGNTLRGEWEIVPENGCSA